MRPMLRKMTHRHHRMLPNPISEDQRRTVLLEKYIKEHNITKRIVIAGSKVGKAKKDRKLQQYDQNTKDWKKEKTLDDVLAKFTFLQWRPNEGKGKWICKDADRGYHPNIYRGLRELLAKESTESKDSSVTDPMDKGKSHQIPIFEKQQQNKEKQNITPKGLIVLGKNNKDQIPQNDLEAKDSKAMAEKAWKQAMADVRHDERLVLSSSSSSSTDTSTSPSDDDEKRLVVSPSPSSRNRSRNYPTTLQAGAGELVWVTQGKTEHLATVCNPIEPARNECIVKVVWASTNEKEYVPVSSLKALHQGLGRRKRRRNENRSTAAAAAAPKRPRRNRSQMTTTTTTIDNTIPVPTITVPTSIIVTPEKKKRNNRGQPIEVLPSSVDVLCGDDFSLLGIEHVGNTTFRSILSSLSETYNASAGSGDHEIAKETMEQIGNRGGRFLRQLPSNESGTLCWKTMGSTETVIEILKSYQHYISKEESISRPEVCYL